MADDSHPVSSLGFREFLFYIVPGSVLVATAAILAGVSLNDVQPLLNFAGATAGVLTAYFLGQVNYTVSTPLRGWLRSGNNRFKRRRAPRLVSDEDERFIRSQLQACHRHPFFYTNEALRYRSLARSYVTLCVPSIALGYAIATRTSSRQAAYAAVVGGVVVSVFFALRFLRCDRMYQTMVEICSRPDPPGEDSSE